MIMASHQIFCSQIWCLSGKTQFDLTHLLYIFNGKVRAFIRGKELSRQISTIIISTVLLIELQDTLDGVNSTIKYACVLCLLLLYAFLYHILCIYVCMCTHTYIHAHLHTQRPAYVHVCMHMYNTNAHAHTQIYTPT